ncbi:hypothetical protein ACP70R_030069 [Stipagrostis hirtigluma subsp. patula]
MSDSNEFAELLWENGQAVVHGRRKQPQTGFPPFTSGSISSSRAQEKHPGADPVALLKTGGVFGAASVHHDFASGLGVNHDTTDLDDTVPWIHYPIIDDESAAPALATDYSPDFFSELQAAAATATNFSSPTSTHHVASNRGAPVANTSREPETSKESHRLLAPAPSTRPEPQPEFAAPKQPRPSGEGLMNFSLFSRPAAMARASLQSAQRPPQGTDKVSIVTATASTRVESTVLQASSGPRTATAPLFADQRTMWPPHKEVRFACAAAPTTVAGNLQQEMPRDRAGNNIALQKKVEARKAPETAGATSSVCSGNGAGIGNDESWHQQKRKNQAECSASQDEDLEDESAGLRRSGSRSTKRSRTAEVHNLSERRRRDRINEKMRALQELIPNCNKIDKASMLDEAIEYLKTLQLQVQMMSMGSGLCIPPMLLPPSMQHLQIPPMAHFPHLSMGLGYGMGVFDMNSTAAVPLQPMHGAHFPCSMIPGMAPQGLGIPGTNTVPMFGVPGQAIHPSGPSAQPLSSLAGLSVRPNLAPQVSSATMANMVQEQQQGVVNQQQLSLNGEASQGANRGGPQLQTILQVENQHFSVPSSGQTESSQFLDGDSNRTNTTGRNGAEK